jgi:hypothetical protein
MTKKNLSTKVIKIFAKRQNPGCEQVATASVARGLQPGYYKK